METHSLRDLFDDDRIALELRSVLKSEAIIELVSLFRLPEPTASRVATAIAEREAIGSTGIGERVAIPHCRTDAVDRIHVAYGRKLSGIEFEAIDGLPVRHVFIIVAPTGAAGGRSREARDERDAGRVSVAPRRPRTIAPRAALTSRKRGPLRALPIRQDSATLRYATLVRGLPPRAHGSL
jgi:mannitol/fructose-specific phosphotransferase system IIA component (Ntr-type)